jgi:hypothetical protein
MEWVRIQLLLREPLVHPPGVFMVSHQPLKRSLRDFAAAAYLNALGASVHPCPCEQFGQHVVQAALL